MARRDWIWMPHPGHFIMGNYCRFVMNTYLGNGYLVSTVGELWPEKQVREIHAKVHDPKWWEENKALKGDDFDAAYFRRFGFEDIGLDRGYETMVFRAIKSKAQCCPYEMASGTDLDMNSYKDADEAYKGHLEMCKTWSRKHK